LEAVMHATNAVDVGPYTARTRTFVDVHTDALRRQFARYDDMVRVCRARDAAIVITHGEPHPGNTMRTANGWRLVDWDTALLAPPERDLWHLDDGDGKVGAAYRKATGTAPDAATIALYRLRWDLADIASYVARFRSPHGATADDEKSWRGLRSTVERLVSEP
jgi:spectinomycin phosphotransferase/16S rRNA (guanine(1405)-N(7))-methyltransferase